MNPAFFCTSYVRVLVNRHFLPSAEILIPWLSFVFLSATEYLLCFLVPTVLYPPVLYPPVLYPPVLYPLPAPSTIFLLAAIYRMSDLCLKNRKSPGWAERVISVSNSQVC